MRIACIGGGPAGLYFSILLKKAVPTTDITVIERNRPGDTFGWGVVFSDKTISGFRDADPQVADAIEHAFRHWDDIDVFFEGKKITSSGHGFCGIARIKLLQILQARALELGVKIETAHDVKDPDEYAREYDLVVGADGVNSVTRQKHEAHFNPRTDVRKCRFMWLGTKKKLDAFTFSFKETEHGWFNLHAYRFDDEWSTFIVETPESTWQAAGLDSMDSASSIRFCETLFADLLEGHALVSNAPHLRGSAWLTFNRILCERWYKDNIVLIGDAAHTAHFSIGSGTKLAMEDAIALARFMSQDEGTIQTKLAAYQKEREVDALKLQSAARNRMTWFEHVDRYVKLAPEQFTFSLLTGSQRVGHENQKLRDPKYIADFDRWFAETNGQTNIASGRAAPSKTSPPPPPMFAPFEVRGLSLDNRVVVSPMCMYSAKDGMPGDFHLVHYGARGTGGAGLLFTEMTDVSAAGRISPGCTGIWNDEQAAAWTRIVGYVHANGTTKMALQLGHAGRKAATRIPWEGGADVALDAKDAWEIMAPSPIPYWPDVSKTPREMTRADMDAVLADFVAATKRARTAGFDMLEVHAAHGYLLSSFLSPLTNVRADRYGGSLDARCVFPLEVVRAVREVWGADRPLSVRISAHDWAPGGNTPGEAAEIARRLKDAGADLLHVSSGQVVKHEKPIYGRMFQVPFSDRIRNEVGIPTIAVGNIFEADHVNTIVAAGRADLCALARPHLADAAWTLRVAAEQGFHGVRGLPQYEAGQVQLERNFAKAMQLAVDA